MQSLAERSVAMMSIVAVVMGVPATACAQGSDAPQSALYVSPGGADTNAGTAGAPFRTLGRARQAVRALHPLSGAVTVYLRSGTYRLVDEDPVYNPDGTLFLNTPNDSGTSQYSVLWTAYPGEIPRISGGRLLPAFAQDGSTINYSQAWSAALDASWLPFASRDLYANGVRLRPARFPNVGWLNLSTINPTATQMTTVLPSPAPPSGSSTTSPFAEIVARRRFVSPRQKLVTWSVAGNTATLTTAGVFGATVDCNGDAWPGDNVRLHAAGGGYPGDHIYLENSPPWMDLAYEWAYDASTNPPKVRLRLPVLNDVPVTPAGAVAPVFEQLVVMEALTNVHFAGIHFEHTRRPALLPEGYYLGTPGGLALSVESECAFMNDMLLTGAVHLIGTNNCTIQGGAVAHTGGSGIVIESKRPPSCQCCAPSFPSIGTSVIGVEIFDVGGNGVAICPVVAASCGPIFPNDASSNGLWIQNATVSNCYIHDFGLTFHDAVGIMAWRNRGLVIDGNEIAYGGMSGMQIGHQYKTDKPPPPAPQCTAVRVWMEDISVTNNNVHHVVRMLADGAGLYTVGEATNALAERNWFHHINVDATFDTVFFPPGGMYWDNYAAGWTVRRNVITGTKHPIIVNDATCITQSDLTIGVNYFDLLYLPVDKDPTFGHWFRATMQQIDDRDLQHQASWITVPDRTFNP